MIDSNNRFEFVAGTHKGRFLGGLHFPNIIRDNETGVLYLHVDGSTIVLVNRDGTPMIDEEYVKEKGWQ